MYTTDVVPPLTPLARPLTPPLKEPPFTALPVATGTMMFGRAATPLPPAPLMPPDVPIRFARRRPLLSKPSSKVTCTPGSIQAPSGRSSLCAKTSPSWTSGQEIQPHWSFHEVTTPCKRPSCVGSSIFSARRLPDLGSVPTSKVTTVPASSGAKESALTMSSLWAKMSFSSAGQENQPHGSFHEATTPSTRPAEASPLAAALAPSGAVLVCPRLAFWLPMPAPKPKLA
mmetsp:Transcript_82953/g.192718  ORF Transcript_82953/g.192718 Transcript_82953/m.192718 type:complete len:228 (-) Transcript_82953:417-1100(-)